MFQECKMISKYHTHPCIHLTHHTVPSRSRFVRVRWIIRHRDVGKSVGATGISAPLCRDAALVMPCCVPVGVVCRLRVGGFGSILHYVKY